MTPGLPQVKGTNRTLEWINAHESGDSVACKKAEQCLKGPPAVLPFLNPGQVESSTLSVVALVTDGHTEETK